MSGTVPALIDTGATLSLISDSVASQLPGAPCLSSQLVVGLGGGETTSLGSLLVSFSFGPLKFSHKFLIMPEASLRHSLILGSDFFQKHGISIDLCNARLAATGTDLSWEVYLRDGAVIPVFRKVPVVVAQDISDSCEEPTFVPVQLDPDTVEIERPSDFYFDGHLVKPFGPYLIGEPGILETHSGKMGLLVGRSAQSSHGIHRFKRGQKLAYLSTLVDVEQPSNDNFVGCAMLGEAFELATKVDLQHLEPALKEQVLAQLAKFTSVFSQGDHDVGCAGVTQHRIELHDDTPIRQKPRRFPQPVADEIERQCEELVGLNILDYSKSPWSSPVVPVKKKDGSIRLCIDYRELNRVTKADRFPIPNMNELVFGLYGMRYFTTLDLVKGYYQVPLDPDSAELTAFSTTRNHYQFNRLSFGLRNAPAAFQREMQEVLRDFDNRQVLVYIDDILIMGKSYEEHLGLLSKVLYTLEQYGIKVKPSKCCWFQSEVEFLGHMVGCSGLRKSDKYMDSIREYSKPTTIKELRSFLGVVHFQRKFIPHCSELCQPLSCLTGRPDREAIIWTTEMDAAFEGLKKAICSDLELAYPDYSAEASDLELATDASGTGAGACLSQMQEGDTRVIAYASMSFSKAQRNYSTIERELTAIRWAVRVFRGFLYGIFFILYTDHRPLVYMSNMSHQNSRLVRTRDELADFDFEVRYRAGKDNVIADTFSRLTDVPDEEEYYKTGGLPEGLTLIKEIAGGGDSMVEALYSVLAHYRGQYNPSLQLPESSLELRKILVEEILAHSDHYHLSAGRSSRAAVKLMRMPGQLPTDVFLVAFANVYNVYVWVHSEFQRPVRFGPYSPLASSDEAVCVHLQCLAGVHYNPLSANRLYTLPSREASVQEESSQSQNLPEPMEIEEGDIGFAVAESPQITCSGGHTSTMLCKTVVKVEDHSFCALVDTGAQFSLISRAARASLKTASVERDCLERPLRIRAVGAVVEAEELIAVEVGFPGSVTEKLTLAVVDGRSMPFCMIIGSDVIQQIPIVVDYGKRSFTFPNRELCPPVAFSQLYVEHASQYEFCLSQGGTDTDLTASLLTRQQVLLAQQSDSTMRMLYGKVLKGIPGGKWTQRGLKPFRNHHREIRINEGRLEYLKGQVAVPLVSFTFLVELALHCHWQANHLGGRKMCDQLRAVGWHPSLQEVSHDIATSCQICQQYKVSTASAPPPMLKVSAAGPFDLLAADLVVLPRSSLGHIGCLVVIDHFSKWLVCVPIRNKSAATVASAFEHRVIPHLVGKPNRLLTDNGKEFVAQEFETVLQEYGLKHVYSSLYKPSSNGAVERVNRTVIEMLRCVAGQNGVQWDKQLARAVVAYNHSWHASISMSPSQMLLQKCHDVRNRPIISSEVQQQWKEGHPNFEPFKVGERVWKKTKLHGDRATNKFVARYSGPYTVTQVRNNGVTYEVKSADDKVLKGHHTQLKKVVPLPDYVLKNASHLQVIQQYQHSQSLEVTGEEMQASSEEDDCDFSGFLPLASSRAVRGMDGQLGIPLHSAYESSDSEEGTEDSKTHESRSQTKGTRARRESVGDSGPSSEDSISPERVQLSERATQKPGQADEVGSGLQGVPDSSTGIITSEGSNEGQGKPVCSTPQQGYQFLSCGVSPILSTRGRQAEISEASRTLFNLSCDILKCHSILTTLDECGAIQEAEIAKLESLINTTPVGALAGATGQTMGLAGYKTMSGAGTQGGLFSPAVQEPEDGQEEPGPCPDVEGDGQATQEGLSLVTVAPVGSVRIPEAEFSEFRVEEKSCNRPGVSGLDADSLVDGEKPPNTVPERENCTPDFSGFRQSGYDEGYPLMESPGNIFGSGRRSSLSPLQESVRQARACVEKIRRLNRERLRAGLRPRLNLSALTEENTAPGKTPVHRPFTQSQGSVREQGTVQSQSRI